MNRPPRRFGRARRLSLARRCAEIALDATYAGGWAARLAHRVGLHGRLEVSEETITLPRWRGWSPLRVAFASECHAGPTTDPRLLDDACHAIEAVRPELVLLGGDFVSYHGRHVDALTRRLALIEAPLGKYAVLGNHDLLADDEYLVEQLEEAGVRVLLNESVRLPEPHAGLVIGGVDDPVQGEMNAARTFDATTGEDARLLLMHAPQGLLDMAGEMFDLALCGHTHGGQVALPGGMPIRMPGPRINRRFASGRFSLREGATLLVTRGIGCSQLPIRLFAPPEIHVLTLVPGIQPERRAVAAGTAGDAASASPAAGASATG